jgi:hypothetical protein
MKVLVIRTGITGDTFRYAVIYLDIEIARNLHNGFECNFCRTVEESSVRCSRLDLLADEPQSFHAEVICNWPEY